MQFIKMLDDRKNGIVYLKEPISKELFNYIYNSHYMYIFDRVSLSKYSPIDCLDNLNQYGFILWSEVLKRNDLTREFIISNFIKFDILKLDYTYYDNHNEMEKKLISHTYSDYSYIIINLLKTKKYSYTELTNLLLIIVHKNKYIHKQNYDMFEIIKLYIDNYYKKHNYTSLNELKKFIEYFNFFLASNQTIYTSNSLIENLIGKSSEGDMDYLVKHKLIHYYTGSCKLPRNIIQYFYDKRYILLDGIINPFIMKGYMFHEVEELIKFYISIDIKKSTIFNHISQNIIDFNTPYWFLKKYQKDIYWDFAFENMINNLQEQDIEKFMQIIVDFSEIIKIQCIDIINDTGTTLILPDELIIYFIDSLRNQISNILSYQKLSVETLVYMIENKYVSSEDLEHISSFQNLNYEFIKKYEAILDTNLLKYNHYITSDIEKCIELKKHNIEYSLHEDYLIIDVSNFGIINHKLNDTYKTVYTDLNKQLYNKNKNINLEEIKNNGYSSINKKNKNNKKQTLFTSVLPYDKRNKVVFNNNPINMDGNILSFTENNLLFFKEINCGPKPMIYMDLNQNQNPNLNKQFKVKVPIRNALIVSKPFQNCTQTGFVTKYNIYIYLPYGTLVDIL
jgi:hypothetical protein